ncbi:MAG: hypothetical protein FWF91_03250 [Coriobacteriia bacterium]|nr:hypothetical protein [Coriobacteriia bacterium]
MLAQLKDIRKKSRFSQADAAFQLGVPLGTYRNWEQCLCMPQDASTLSHLADFFKVGIDELIGRKHPALGALIDASGGAFLESNLLAFRNVEGEEEIVFLRPEVEKKRIEKLLNRDFPQALKNLGEFLDYYRAATDNEKHEMYRQVLNITTGSGYIDAPLFSENDVDKLIEHSDPESWFPVPRRFLEDHQDAFLLANSCTSMDKILPRGCYALVDPQQTDIYDRQMYAVIVNGDYATIRRLERLNNGVRMIPDSTDPTHEVITVDFNRTDPKNLQILGRVIWVTFPSDHTLQ